MPCTAASSTRNRSSRSRSAPASIRSPQHAANLVAARLAVDRHLERGGSGAALFLGDLGELRHESRHVLPRERSMPLGAVNLVGRGERVLEFSFPRGRVRRVGPQALDRGVGQWFPEITPTCRAGRTS